MKKRILIVLGTRPEALKFAPLIRALEQSRHFNVLICDTGQHREMLRQVTRFFKLPVHHNLRIMKKNQTLEYVSGQVITRFRGILDRVKPHLVFVQGDTATALMTGIACYYARVPLAHLEAGLRSHKKFEPFPEEMNRRLLSHLADYHFTPTSQATRQLKKEGVPARTIFQVGNTIVDTVGWAKSRLKNHYSVFRGINLKNRILLVTAHRRESFGAGLRGIYQALKETARRYPDVEIVYPVHMNPNVHRPAHQMLGGHPRIHLIRPLSCEETYWLIRRCYFVLTDSGGIQEEAPSFRKPVLVLRNVTEREEGIRAGVARLVGTDQATIVREASRLLDSPREYRRMRASRNPYGDGQASERIVNILRRELFQAPRDTPNTTAYKRPPGTKIKQLRP